VLGDEYIAHIVEGDTVIRYSKPTLSENMVSGFKPEAMKIGTAVTQGYLALQSESHPIQFRRVAIKDLSNQ
jgi:hypothetical protein